MIYATNDWTCARTCTRAPPRGRRRGGTVTPRLDTVHPPTEQPASPRDACAPPGVGCACGRIRERAEIVTPGEYAILQ